MLAWFSARIYHSPVGENVNQIVRLVTWLYALLANLYPPAFRVDFKEEMTVVFAQAVVEAAEQGWLSLTAVCLRELRDLALNLAREHWHSLTKKELPMTIIHKKPEWHFYPTWITLTMLCVPIAFILDLVILIVITSIVGDFIYVGGTRHITEDYLFSYTFPLIMGLVTGTLQYGLLRRYLPRMGWWVLSTIGGWLLGALLTLIPGWLNWTNAVLDLDLVFIVMGLSIGVGQWLLLQRRLPQAGWWIGANVVGWGLIGLITAGNSLDQFGLLALGFLPACVTAVVLGLLMNRVQPTGPHGA